MGLHQWAGRHQLWLVNPHFRYRGDQRDRDPLEAQGGVVGEGGGEGPKRSRGTQAGNMRGLMKGLRGPIESQLGKGLTGICRS